MVLDGCGCVDIVPYISCALFDIFANF